MKIIVTGCAGFIGSHSTRALLKKGYEILGIDNFNDYYDPAQKEENVSECLDKENFKLARIDILEKEKVDAIFEEFKPDLLLHLAARAGVRPSIENPELYHRVNVEGTLNLLEACKKFDTKKVVFASSSSVYGNQEKIPFSESDFTENPISPYAATKLAGEKMCYMYSKIFGLKITCLRFFTVYGPCGRPDMAPYLFVKAINEGQAIKKFGNGKTKRDYTYIDDIVSGIVSACEKEFDFEVINLGNNQPVELNKFISVIEKVLDKKAEITEMPKQPGDVDITFADISKAKKLLNYEPKTSIEEGMQKFINWHLEQNEILIPSKIKKEK